MNHAKNECRYPMKLDTLKSKYPEMYEEVMTIRSTTVSVEQEKDYVKEHEEE